VDLSSVLHLAKSHMAYAFDDSTIHLRLQTKKGLLNSVKVIAGDPFQYEHKETFEWVSFANEVEMELEATSSMFDHYFLALKPPFKRMKYAFVLDERYLFGTREIINLKENPSLKRNLFNYFNFPYLLKKDLFKAPKWAQNQIWYSIFPSRFNRHKDALPFVGLRAWDDLEGLNNHVKYGGTLKGITEKLDYIKDVGFTALYLTPIFLAGTEHKYDTIDYFKIDPEFGTEADLIELVDEAHQRGIRVVLDAVFNHTSAYHPFFIDVVKNGKHSPYYDYYTLVDESKPILPFDLDDLIKKDYKEIKKIISDESLNYQAFGFTPFMPKINCDHKEVTAYFMDVATYWVKKARIDGYRLDVSNEVSHSFWRTFRNTLKDLNKDLYIVGENWDNSNPWLQGDQYDSVMNYGLLFPLWQTFGHVEGMPLMNAETFVEQISLLKVSYPKHVLKAMYNLVDSHDTTRLLNLTSHNLKRFKQAYFFLFAFPGSPSVFYGDEAGLDGAHDPLNRKPMPWNRLNQELITWFKKLIRLRNEEKAMQSAEFKISADQDIIKFLKDDFLLILFNLGKPRTLALETTYYDYETSTPMTSIYLEKDSIQLLKKG